MPPMSPKNKPQGPDPAVLGAIQRLQRTELSPLEEVMFKAWAQANQIDDPDSPDNTFDFRKAYQDMDGKVMPPGEVAGMAEKESALQILMRAQEEHEKNSPLKLFHEAVTMSQGGQAPEAMPQDPSQMAPEGPPQGLGAMDAMMGSEAGGF